MKLKELLNGVSVKEIIGNINDVEIADISIDSKKIIEKSLFVCIKGINKNGNDFIFEAEKYGATAVISEYKTETSLPLVLVEDARETLSVICSNFYGYPQKKLKIIGVTGTNGKTTITYMIDKILRDNKCKTAIIGTLGVIYANKKTEPTLTTPDTIDLFKFLDEFTKNGVQYVIMEVSAHALYLKKVFNIEFDVGIFTNLTQDHLDYFKNLEEYKKAKKILFFNSKHVISNSDDKAGLEIIREHKDSISYGIKNPSDVFAIDVIESLEKTEFYINLFDNVEKITLKMIGEFNVYNALASATCCYVLGISPSAIFKSLNGIIEVNGRLNKVYDKEFSIFIDYAHTPDGLNKTLKVLKRLTKNKLISVFGCGGDRDKTKRSIMGKISGKTADFSVITNDNPRFEEPMSIINEIENGIKEVMDNYVLIEDRFSAIEYAIKKAEKGDIVLISGKGGEKYQDVLGVKKLYNDYESVNRVLEENGL